MIPLMNLTRQYEQIREKLDAAIQDVMASGQYVMGSYVQAFEEAFAEYIGVRYAVAVGNGTDALVIALKALGIRPDDEVIVPGMSFFATAEAVSRVGGKPVFVDVHADDYTLHEEQLESSINKKTKAIIPVHLYGCCANMSAIRTIAQKYKLFVVEDVAQATGAKQGEYFAGSLGDVGCFSFFPTKNLGCAGDGGMITTNNETIARKCRAYRVHGSGLDGQFASQTIHETENVPSLKFQGQLSKYFNFVIGFNSRLDEIQAALLYAKLPYLDGWNSRRREIAQAYHTGIKNSLLIKPIETSGRYHVYYTYVLLTKHRDRFREYMRKHGITTGIYFPVPLHLQTVYKALGYKRGDLPNAETVANCSVAIPMFPELEKTEIETIIDVSNRWNG